MREKLRELDLNLLVILDALLRCESVSQAAQDLEMSQSAVSHALMRLRELFGDELFVRSRKGMSPTPKAQQISNYVHEIIRLSRITLLPTQAFDPDTSHRTVTLALGDVGDMSILPTLSKHFRETNAKVKIVSSLFTSDEAIQELGSGKLDLYVGVINTSSSDIFCQKLYEDRLVVITSNKNPLNKTINFNQFAQLEHIVLQRRTKTQAGNPVLDLFEKEGLHRKVAIETPHIASIPMILEQNPELVASLPASLGEYYTNSFDVKVLEPEFFFPTPIIKQFWHRRFNNDPFIVWIRETLCKLFQNH